MKEQRFEKVVENADRGELILAIYCFISAVIPLWVSDLSKGEIIDGIPAIVIATYIVASVGMGVVYFINFLKGRKVYWRKIK